MKWNMERKRKETNRTNNTIHHKSLFIFISIWSEYCVEDFIPAQIWIRAKAKHRQDTMGEEEEEEKNDFKWKGRICQQHLFFGLDGTQKK